MWAEGDLPASGARALLLKQNVVGLLLILVNTIPALAGYVCGNSTIWVSEIDTLRYNTLNTAGCS